MQVRSYDRAVGKSLYSHTRFTDKLGSCGSQRRATEWHQSYRSWVCVSRGRRLAADCPPTRRLRPVQASSTNKQTPPLYLRNGVSITTLSIFTSCKDRRIVSTMSRPERQRIRCPFLVYRTSSTESTASASSTAPTTISTTMRAMIQPLFLSHQLSFFAGVASVFTCPEST